MMNGNGGVYAKIRAMNSRLLQYEDYCMLASCRDIESFAYMLARFPAYNELQKMPAGQIGRRIPLERELLKSYYEDYTKLHTFITDISSKKYLQVFFFRFEINLLKMLIRRLLDKRDLTNAIPEYDHYFSSKNNLDINRLVHSQNIEEMIANLNGTVFYPVLSQVTNQNKTAADLERILDLFYYDKLFKAQNRSLKHKDLKTHRQVNGLEVDLQNLMRIYRLKTYYKLDPVLIYTHLIPYYYKISKKQMEQWLSADKEEFKVLISHSCYGSLINFDKSVEIEKNYYMSLKKAYLTEYKKNPFSLISVTAYLFLKNLEIKNLTSLLECVRYGIAKKDSLSRLYGLQEKEMIPT